MMAPLLGLGIGLGMPAACAVAGTLIGWRRDRVSPFTREFWTA